MKKTPRPTNSKLLPVDEVRHLIREHSTWDIIVHTSESVLEALDIEARYKTSFWDARIVQAAAAPGASVLYSEDLADRQKYGAIHVVNPLTVPTRA